MSDKQEMIKLGEGKSIRHKKKKYVGEIPKALFEEIYGEVDEAGKLTADGKRKVEAMAKKMKPEKKEIAPEPEVKK